MSNSMHAGDFFRNFSATCVRWASLIKALKAGITKWWFFRANYSSALKPCYYALEAADGFDTILVTLSATTSTEKVWILIDISQINSHTLVSAKTPLLRQAFCIYRSADYIFNVWPMLYTSQAAGLSGKMLYNYHPHQQRCYYFDIIFTWIFGSCLICICVNCS